MNGCFSDQFDAKESVSSLEKKNLLNHKCTPKQFCTVTPEVTFIKHFKANVQNLNLDNKIESDMKLDILDINKAFNQNHGVLSSDGLHPSDAGVGNFVQIIRDCLKNSLKRPNSCQISTRLRMKQPHQLSKKD